MNLTHLTDQQLMINTKKLVKSESELLLTILQHIKEIDRRRLFSDYKQPGLLELVMNELGYPKDQALRRIIAMRMMRDNPVVEEKIKNGVKSNYHRNGSKFILTREKRGQASYLL